MKKVTVVLPTYNEKENIVELINRISSCIKGYTLQIIVVDDNSPDETWKIVSIMKNPFVKVIRRMSERGIASAIGEGVKRAEGDYVVWMDCDMSLPPEKIPQLLKRLDEGYDIAIGSRYVEGGKDSRPFIRQSTSYMINLYARLILGYGIRDYDSGFIAVKREVFSVVKFPAYGYGEYFIEFVYKSAKKGYKITEVGYNNVDRTKGTSKTASSVFMLLKYGMQYAKKVIDLKLEKEK
jgi:dolichol-phosphate mannosyltransferase